VTAAPAAHDDAGMMTGDAYVMSDATILAEHRLARLHRWLGRQLVLGEAGLTLPRSRVHYTVLQPAGLTRDRLLSAAHTMEAGPRPFWAQIWASGVALADTVLARRQELAGRPVVELGSGLGVTASAALMAGARLITADYSLLALALCRYNTLRNVGRAPRALALDWRTPAATTLARAGPAGSVPIILAADVLYESRDIAPLQWLVDRLLTPGGTLWLAEPGRQTADRFLIAMAAAGWRCSTETAVGPWPDGTTRRVYLHFLQRPADPEPFDGLLGGWRA
jgi:predicted nicotinamide N-methyase